MEWISVKDRLPADYEKTIVLNEDANGLKEIDMAYFHAKKSNKHIECFAGFDLIGRFAFAHTYKMGRFTNVTHWMPLPEPPREREKPPLGLVPKRIHNAERRKEILAAMMRYAEEEKVIPLEWLGEYNELLEGEA